MGDSIFDSTTIITKLKRNPLFTNFPRELLLSRIKEGTLDIWRADKNQVLYLQNQTCETLDIILDGALTVQGIDENGNVLTLDTFAEPDAVGAGLLFSDHRRYPMTVRVSANSCLASLSREDVVTFCQLSPEFLWEFLRLIANKAALLAGKIQMVSFKSIRDCLTDFLLYEYQRQGRSDIRLEFSKKELAERFGVRRSSLSRELARMRNEGLVTYDANTISLKAPSRLRS